MTDKVALVTGATSGIGRETALILAEQGFNLIICGRRKERLEELEKTINPARKVLSLCFDVQDQKQVVDKLSKLPTPFDKVDILINNAGNAHGLDLFHESPTSDWEAMIDSNVKGLLYVSKMITPIMVKRKMGQIINIGSIAGKEVYPKGHVYCASKHAVDAITKGMRIDLNPYNIRVGAIHPGLVETEFSLVRFKGDQDKAQTVYQGYSPLTPKDIAEIIAFAVSRPPHVNIADLLVLPTAQASSQLVHKEP